MRRNKLIGKDSIDGRLALVLLVAILIGVWWLVFWR
jgi:hypothetical protein